MLGRHGRAERQPHTRGSTRKPPKAHEDLTEVLHEVKGETNRQQDLTARAQRHVPTGGAETCATGPSTHRARHVPGRSPPGPLPAQPADDGTERHAARHGVRTEQRTPPAGAERSAIWKQGARAPVALRKPPRRTQRSASHRDERLDARTERTGPGKRRTSPDARHTITSMRRVFHHEDRRRASRTLNLPVPT